jgi:hypothetical protein
MLFLEATFITQRRKPQEMMLAMVYGLKETVMVNLMLVSPRESGLLMLGDLRNMRTIQVGDETHLLVAKP